MKLVSSRAVALEVRREGITWQLAREGKPVMTPAGNALALPTQALAEAIAEEWRQAQQGGKLNKDRMGLTALSSIALDLATPRREALLEDVLPYIDTDLVSYRAGDTPELLAREEQGWDPLLAWAEKAYGIRLATTGGVLPVAQPPENTQNLSAQLERYDAWRLAAYAAAVKPLGSALLALALLEGKLNADEAFRLAHLEEEYETQKWGHDEEKEKHLALKKADLRTLERFLQLLSD